MDSFQFYAFNLLANPDARKAAELYHSIFGFPILMANESHAELEIHTGTRLIFSRPKKLCPVEPGTLTLLCKDFFLEGLSEFQIESKATETYWSFLDPWNNRIWLYISQELSLTKVQK
ncbi:hypothetical protein [Leptospira ryugenii]|nr:hypothetical protein [Leptospira ryugenii]